MTVHAPDPLAATVAALRDASRRPMRYRTKRDYRRTIPARDRLFFEQAWTHLLQRGELVIARPIRPSRPLRYVTPGAAA
jgi:hypothetical protein